MRQVTKYSGVIKANVLAKAFTPNPPRVVELAREFNIPVGTIYTWILNMRNKQENAAPQRPNDKSAEVKLQAVIDTMGKTPQEQAEYCRKHGIHSNHLDVWKAQMLEGLGAASIRTKELKHENQQIANENKQLKRDLHRKEKALAEVSALLVLKKKADLLWGTTDEDV